MKKWIMFLVGVFGLVGVSVADLQILDIGTISNRTIVASTATNAIINTYSNNSIYANTPYQIDLSYTVADSSTVSVYIANASLVRTLWFSITNSSTVYKNYIPAISYYILPGSSLVISNSMITANTNLVKVLMGGTFKP